MKEYTRAEVSRSVPSRDAALIIIHNKVYNVGSFLRLHPGGEAVLARFVGMDATAAFEAVGHSTHARKLMEGLCVGALVAEDCVNV